MADDADSPEPAPIAGFSRRDVGGSVLIRLALGAELDEPPTIVVHGFRGELATLEALPSPPTAYGFAADSHVIGEATRYVLRVPGQEDRDLPPLSRISEPVSQATSEIRKLQAENTALKRMVETLERRLAAEADMRQRSGGSTTAAAGRAENGDAERLELTRQELAAAHERIVELDEMAARAAVALSAQQARETRPGD